MPKGIIKANNSDGSYSVEVVYDNRDDIEAELSEIEGKINTAKTGYLKAFGNMTAIESELETLEVSLKWYKDQCNNYGLYQTELEATEKEISRKNKERINYKIKYETLKADYFTYLGRQDKLNDFPENPTQTIWCADYSINYEVGNEVGLIAIAGCDKWNGWNMQPGFNRKALYDAGRDNKLHHTYPGFNLPWSYIWYIISHPGMQRWRPTTRHAVIISFENPILLDYVDVDLDNDLQCYVRYLPAYSGPDKTLVNKYPEDQHNVPVRYMSCNHNAFDEGDEVLVEFTSLYSGYPKRDQEEWDRPTIIGFKENPQPCTSYLYYMGDPILCLDEDGNVQEDCDESDNRYYRVFDVIENIETDVNISFENNNGISINKVCRPPVWLYGSSKSGHGQYDCYNNRTISLDQWAVHAIEWLVQNPGGNEYYWACCVDNGGAHWEFPSTYPEDPSATTDVYPEETPFPNRLPCSQFEMHGNYTPNKAFDLFRLNSDIDHWEYKEGDYILTMCGDPTIIHIINLTRNDIRTQSTGLYGTILADYPDEEHLDIVTRVLGINEFTVYVAVASMAYQKMTQFSDIYDFDAETLATNRYEISGDVVVYNRFTNELWSVDHGEIGEIVSTDSKIWNFQPDDGDPNCVCCLDPVNYDCILIYARGVATEDYQAIGYSPSGFAQNNYWDIGAPGTEQEGYFGGMKSTSPYITSVGAQITTIAYSGCGGFGHPVCGEIDWYATGYGIRGCVTCEIYEGFVSNKSQTDKISITENGTGEIRIVESVYGEKCASGLSQCPYGVGTDIDTTETIEKEIVSGDYDPLFGMALWPHENQFAWLKRGVDNEGNTYNNALIMRDSDGNVVYDGEIIDDDSTDLFLIMESGYGYEND